MPLRKESFLHAILSSVTWKSGERGASFFKHIVIASAIGLSTQLDIYYMVIALLGLFVFSWGSLVEIVAVPALVACQQEGDVKKFRTIASGLFQLTLLGSAVLAGIILLASDYVAEVAIGFDEARKARLADAFFWVLPMMLFWVPKSFLLSLLRAKRHFSTSYQGDFILGAAGLLCIIIWWDVPHVLLWSASFAVVACFLFVLAFTWRDVLLVENPFQPTVLTVFTLAPGLLLLQSATLIFSLTDRIYLSFLEAGKISAFAYALAIVLIMPGAVNTGLSFLTVLAEEKSRAKRSEKFNDLVSLCVFASVVVGCFLLVGGEDAVRFLFERGLFDDEATANVSLALVALSPLVFTTIVQPLFDNIALVEKRIGVMVIRVAIGIVANIILSGVALFVLGWGLFGIALATTLSNWIMLLASAQAARKLGYNISFWRHLAWGVWLGLWAVVAMVVLFFVPASTAWGGLVQIMVVGMSLSLAVGLGAMVYLGRERQLIMSTLGRMLRRVVAVVRRRG